MDLTHESAIERIKELDGIIARLEGDIAYYVTTTDLLLANLEDRDLRIAHLIGELSKSKTDPSYEAQISVAR
jgi:hypothetical protein